MDLIALENIRRLKHRYMRCVDLKLWDELGSTFVPDATTSYGTHALGEPLTFAGRDTIVEFMRANLGSAITTMHFAGMPELDVDGDRATGIWCFHDTVIVTEYRMMIFGSGYYNDRYVRGDDGEWRFEHTGYERTYEASVSLDDTPSFKLIANRWTGAATPS